MLRDRLALHLTAPLKRLRTPNATVERWVETPLGPEDHAALAKACAASGQRLGAFYHWYYQKLLVSRRVRSLDEAGIKALIEQFDGTDYGALDRAADRDGGLLVAIPHHGHYILSMIAIAQHLSARRKVMLFYGNPATHAGNEVFDHLYSVIFGDSSCGVEVIHDTRAGMVKAIRGLQRSEVVIIMPDVHRSDVDSYQVPFCGIPLNVMLGTAVLARKTGSSVIPVVSQPVGGSLGFRNTWGTTLHVDPAEDDEVRGDYRLTAAMFAFFDKVKRGEILYWQFVRQHFMSEDQFPELDPSRIGEIADLVLGGPSCDLNLGNTVVLGT